MQSYDSYAPPRAHKKRRVWLITILSCLSLASVAAAGYFVFLRDEKPTHQPAPVQDQQTPPVPQPQPDSGPKPLPTVQKELDKWLKSSSGDYGVAVHDVATGEALAESGEDEPYFTASIYKLYVAYLGYLDIQDGKHDLDDPFLGDWTRGDCLDKMIRESHSPCAEKLWVEQDKDTSTKRLKEFGLTGTSMTGLTTTAHDSNVILLRLAQGKELNKTHTKLLLGSMSKQIYRDALPKALPELKVSDKVGFRELVEYHDVGLVTLPNGRQVAISLLTRNAGTRRMIDLTQTIFAPLIEAAE